MKFKINMEKYNSKCKICGKFIPNNHELKYFHERTHEVKYTYELPSIGRIIEHFKNIF